MSSVFDDNQSIYRTPRDTNEIIEIIDDGDQDEIGLIDPKELLPNDNIFEEYWIIEFYEQQEVRHSIWKLFPTSPDTFFPKPIYIHSKYKVVDPTKRTPITVDPDNYEFLYSFFEIP